MHEGEFIASKNHMIETLKVGNEISSFSMRSELPEVVNPLYDISGVDPTGKDAFLNSGRKYKK